MKIGFTKEQEEYIDEMCQHFGNTRLGIIQASLELLWLAKDEMAEGNSLGIIEGNKVLKEITGVGLPTEVKTKRWQNAH